MYTAFFGLREKPFALSPNPRFLYLSASHREALAHLLYGIEQGEGFIAVTGEVGTGKTTLCRTLLRRLAGDVEVAFLFNPKLSAHELLEAILAELDIKRPEQANNTRELIGALNEFLLEKSRVGRRVLLIIDEAQGLAAETLEQIRLLSNLETESAKLLQILLLGQPELDEMLASDALRQLRQRIGVRWRLAPLSRSETAGYVNHRLQVAGGAQRPVFTERALRDLHRRAAGVPRVINLLADRALLGAYSAGEPKVGPDFVRRAARELQADGGVGTLGQASWRRGLVAASVALALAAATTGLAWWKIRDDAAVAVARSAARGDAISAERGASATTAADGPQSVDPVALSTLESTDLDVPAVSAPPESIGAAALVGVEPVVGEPVLAAPSTPAAADAAAQASDGLAAAGVSDGVAGGTPDPTRLGEPLGQALLGQAPGATAAASLRGLLAAWSAPASVALPGFVPFERVLDELAAQGLGVFGLPATDLATLRMLDHPVLLRLWPADGVARLAALTGFVEGGAARVEGLGPMPAQVSPDELASLWQGEAFIVWRDFEPLPDLMRRGDRGQGVWWLQGALAELGFLPGTASGRYDAATELAVRAFQADRSLEPDGTVGPLTKMSIYASLPRYAVPRLVRADALQAASTGGPG